MWFKNGRCNKVVIELRDVQFKSKIILEISNRTRAVRSFDFEIMHIISDQIAPHSVQLPFINCSLWNVQSLYIMCTWHCRFREDVFREGQVGGNCIFKKELHKEQGKNKSPLQSWLVGFLLSREKMTSPKKLSFSLVRWKTHKKWF